MLSRDTQRGERKVPRAQLTEGSIVRSLIRLSVPIVFANVLQTAYQLTDTFWVGRLGAEAVAAVSLSFPIIFLLVSLGAGLVVAGSILVAQYTGQRNQRAADHVAGQTLLMMLVCSAVISLVGWLLAPAIMDLMAAGPSVTASAVVYLRITLAGLVFFYGYFVFQSLMRGVGDVTTPLYIVLTTVLLNLVLDPLLILGPGPFPALGIRGAAISTVITQCLSAVVGITLLFRGNYGIRLRAGELWPDAALIRKIVGLGIPASLEQSTRAMGLTLMTFLVSTFGTTAIAAYGIGVRLLSFVIIPALGFSMATSTLVGQNIGAGKMPRAQTAAVRAIWVAFLVLTALGGLAYVLATPLVRTFPDDPAVIKGGARFIRLMAFTFGLIGVQQVINGVFRGSGNTLMAMMFAILSLWVLRFPLAYILSKHTTLGEDGIWWAFPVSNVLAATIALLWFARGSWKRKKLIEETVAEQVTEETIIEGGLD